MNVDVDLSSIEKMASSLESTINTIQETEQKLNENYKKLAGEWNDAKYRELGSIVNECQRSLKKTKEELKKAYNKLLLIVQHLVEYENTDLIAATGSLGSLFSRLFGGERSGASSGAASWRRISGEHTSTADLQASNPQYNEGTQWQVNCQRCVPTYEMRRRGYDVTALPNDGSNTYLSYHPFDVWDGAQVQPCTGSGREDISSTMSEWGDGSRAQVVVVWDNSNSGHTFIAEQVNGETRFVDPQTGETDVSYYFDNVQSGHTRFCRIDNLNTSNRINDCCREV